MGTFALVVLSSLAALLLAKILVTSAIRLRQMF